MLSVCCNGFRLSREYISGVESEFSGTSEFAHVDSHVTSYIYEINNCARFDDLN